MYNKLKTTSIQKEKAEDISSKVDKYTEDNYTHFYQDGIERKWLSYVLFIVIHTIKMIQTYNSSDL